MKRDSTGKPSFAEVYYLLLAKGPGKATSTRGTEYLIMAKNGEIVAFPRRGRVTVHEDCWGDNTTCQKTRAGGIFNGPYSIYDWYRENR